MWKVCGLSHREKILEDEWLNFLLKVEKKEKNKKKLRLTPKELEILRKKMDILQLFSRISY